MVDEFTEQVSLLQIASDTGKKSQDGGILITHLTYGGYEHSKLPCFFVELIVSGIPREDAYWQCICSGNESMQCVFYGIWSKHFPSHFSSAKLISNFLTTYFLPQAFHDKASCSIPILHHIADPEQDHEFVYNEQGHVVILNSPFFDVNPEVDQTVEEYIQRITFTLAAAIDDQLSSVQWKLEYWRKPPYIGRSDGLALLLVPTLDPHERKLSALSICTQEEVLRSTSLASTRSTLDITRERNPSAQSLLSLGSTKEEGLIFLRILAIKADRRTSIPQNFNNKGRWWKPVFLIIPVMKAGVYNKKARKEETYIEVIPDGRYLLIGSPREPITTDFVQDLIHIYLEFSDLPPPLSYLLSARWQENFGIE
ncbi:hypothetical protein M5K25_007033 [Dendrobium thyrsiflorum]|uniref:Uncharacterized protein n=1 Tax=Dendrobium thyrsiflorum TaxID=117978 RepID=A0ABD0VKE3_DENTH